MSAQAQNNTSLFNNPESNQGAQGTFHGPVYIHLARLLPKDENQPQEVDYRVRLRELLPLPDADSNPYPGLVPFDKNRYDRFFGRETLLYNLIHHLRKKPFLALLGASGSGKSSLVRAGIVPMLEAGALPGSQHWRCITIRPEDRPLDKLVAGLIPSERTITGKLELWSKLPPSRAIQTVADLLNTRIVLVIDQAEELWTNAPTEPSALAEWRTQQQEPFIQALLSTLQTPTPSMIVIFAMRADFLHRAAEHAHLAQLIADNLAIVSPMTTDELRAAIARPAVLAGGRFEKQLVNELIAKAEQSPSTLPLLSYTLRELWNKRSDTLITWEAYGELGGVEGALAQRAEEIFQAYAPEQQPLIRKLLLRLVRPGEGTEDTRRRQSFSELAETGQTADEVQVLLQPLINERLLTADRDQQGLAVVEMSHEALIRAWPRLEEWIKNERDMLRFQLQLAEAAKEWQKDPQDADLLWRDSQLNSAQARLGEAEGQLDLSRLNERERDFLQASQAAKQARSDAAERVRRDRVQLLQRAFLSVSSLLAVALILLVLYFRTADAERERANEAERAGRVSRAQALAANAVAQLTDDPERGILLALEAISVTRTLGEPVVPQAIEALQHALITSQVRLTLAGHTDSVMGVKYSPDNRILATASKDGAVKLWDAQSGRELQTLRDHYYGLYDIAHYSYETGKEQFVLVGDKETIWIANGKDTNGHNIYTDNISGRIYSVTYRSDGKQFVTTGNSINLWNPETNERIIHIPGEDGYVYSSSYSPDNKHLVTGSENGKINIWESETGKHIKSLEGHTDRVISTRYSYDGATILTTSWDKTVRIWQAETGALLGTLNGHTDRVRDAVYNPDNTLVASVGWDKTVLVWDAQTFAVKFKLEGYTQRLTKVIFSPKGEHILTIDEAGDLRIWDTGTGAEKHRIHISDTELRGLAYNANKNQIIVTGLSGYVYILDAKTTKIIQSFPGRPAQVNAVDFSPDGKSLVTASWDATVKVWDLATNTVRFTIRGHEDIVLFASFSPDGKRILTGGNITDSHPVRIWNSSTGENILSVKRGDSGSVQPKYSHDGKWIISSVTNTSHEDKLGPRKVTIIDSHNGNLIKTITASKMAYSTAFSPDNKSIVVGQEDGIIQVFDIESERELFNLYHRGFIAHFVTFSHDGLNIISSSANGVHIWNSKTREKIATYKHSIAAYVVDFSKYDDHIAVAGADGKARIWNLRGGVEGFGINTLNRIAGIDGLSFNPSGERIIIVNDGDDTAKVWNTQKAQLIGNLDTEPLEAKGIYNAAYTPDGKYILGSDAYNTIYLWDAKTLKLIRKIEGGYAAYYCATDRVIASSVDNKGVKMWDLQTGKQVMSFEGQGITGLGVFRSLCTNDGKKLLTQSGHIGSKNYKLVIWDTQTGKPERIIKLPDFCTKAMISPDGKDIVTTGLGYINIWNISDGTLKYTLKGQSGMIWGSSYSDDGNHIVAANMEGLVTVWDAKTNKITMSLPKSQKPITSVAFHPNSRSIAVAYMDGEVQEYLVDLDDLLALARTRVLRQLTPEERSQFLGEALPSPTQQPTAVP